MVICEDIPAIIFAEVVLVNEYLIISSVNPSEVVLCFLKTPAHRPTMIIVSDSNGLLFFFLFERERNENILVYLTVGSLLFACECHVCDAM